MPVRWRWTATCSLRWQTSVPGSRPVQLRGGCTVPASGLLTLSALNVAGVAPPIMVFRPSFSWIPPGIALYSSIQVPLVRMDRAHTRGNPGNAGLEAGIMGGPRPRLFCLTWAARAGLMINLFNLMPIGSMDGGVCLHATLSRGRSVRLKFFLGNYS